MITKDDRLKLFVNELGDITEENLRKFAEELISNADDYFFTVAASTSGKYHPQFDLGDGGLVRHTRCVVFFAECEAISRCFTQHETNLMIVSAIAHDIKKLGDGLGKHTVDEHPTFAANYIAETNKRTNLLSAEDEELIKGMVHSHMGKWGHEKTGLPIPQTDLEKALQAADYIASRKELLGFDFRPTEAVETPKKTMSTNPADFIVGFGKHSGKTIKQVYSEGRKGDTYLHWMMKQDDFNNQETRLNGMKYLYDMGELPEKYLNEISDYVDSKSGENKNVVEEVKVASEDDLPF